MASNEFHGRDHLQRVVVCPNKPERVMKNAVEGG